MEIIKPTEFPEQASILFLDDDPNRARLFKSKFPWATIVETAQECIKELKKGDLDFLSADHDLGDTVFQNPADENSGSAVVRWIEENKPNIGQIIIHSYNASAAQAMRAALIRSGYDVVYLPFCV
jgi:ActR/RegA family two-component response regulator